MACAEETLPRRPLGEAEFAEMIKEAGVATMRLILPTLAEWLPDIRENYRILIPSLR